MHKGASSTRMDRTNIVALPGRPLLAWVATSWLTRSRCVPRSGGCVFSLPSVRGWPRADLTTRCVASSASHAPCAACSGCAQTRWSLLMRIPILHWSCSEGRLSAVHTAFSPEVGAWQHQQAWQQLQGQCHAWLFTWPGCEPWSLSLQQIQDWWPVIQHHQHKYLQQPQLTVRCHHAGIMPRSHPVRAASCCSCWCKKLADDVLQKASPSLFWKSHNVNTCRQQSTDATVSAARLNVHV